MRKILLVTRHTPLPWEDGAGAYIFGLLHYLHGAGFEIHVAWLAPHDHLRWQGIWTLPKDFASVVRLHTPGGWRIGRRQIYPSTYWQPFKARLLHRTKQALAVIGLHVGRAPQKAGPSTPQPASCAWMATPSQAERAFTADIIRRVQPEVIIAKYAWMTSLFPDASAAPHLRRVCLHSDVSWKRAAMQAQVEGRPAEITRQEETAWLRQAEIIVSITEADRDEHRAMAAAAHVIAAPKAVTPHPLLPATGRRVLFVGSGNAFNIEGLEWFLSGVWPLVRQTVPDAILDIVGSIDRAMKLRPAGVIYHGQVTNLTALYKEAAVVVVPLLHATGLNIKLVDSAAFGRAIVATPITLVGAPFLRDAVLTAETAADFAAAVHRLLLDPAARSSAAERGLAAVRSHLSPEICYGPLVTQLNRR